MVQQAGFQELFALERHERPSANCPICYETVGHEGPVVATPGPHGGEVKRHEAP